MAANPELLQGEVTDEKSKFDWDVERLLHLFLKALVAEQHASNGFEV